jgi:subtilase family serine protease
MLITMEFFDAFGKFEQGDGKVHRSGFDEKEIYCDFKANPNMNRLQRGIAVVRAVLFGLFGILLSTDSQAQELPSLTNRVQGIVRDLQPIGRVSEFTRLHLAIGLPLRNREALTNLLRKIYEPSAPEYHRYLTPQQFTEQFGPEDKDYQALIHFVETNGLTVRSTYRTRMLLDVDGSVGDLERTFHMVLRTYPHPKESRMFFAPDRSLSVPANIPVLTISGLDDFILPKPSDLHATRLNAKAKPLGTGSQLGGFFGNDFRTAYAPGVTLDGTGQSVGIVAFDGFYTNDVETYKNWDGATNVVVTSILLDGFNGNPGAHNIETELDIETPIAMAPGLASVIVYEGLQADSILGRMAADNLARQLSSSWTFGLSPTVLQAFQEFAAQGQVMFQASGDNGAYAGLVPEPIEMPDVVTVGGTSLITDGGGEPWVDETVWHWSGGGYITSITIPTNEYCSNRMDEPAVPSDCSWRKQRPPIWISR